MIGSCTKDTAVSRDMKPRFIERRTLRRRLPPGHAKEHVAESRSMYFRGDPSMWLPSF